jgi:hypothetical protein
MASKTWHTVEFSKNRHTPDKARKPSPNPLRGNLSSLTYPGHRAKSANPPHQLAPSHRPGAQPSAQHETTLKNQDPPGTGHPHGVRASLAGLTNIKQPQTPRSNHQPMTPVTPPQPPKPATPPDGAARHRPRHASTTPDYRRGASWSGKNASTRAFIRWHLVGSNGISGSSWARLPVPARGFVAHVAMEGLAPRSLPAPLGRATSCATSRRGAPP